MTTPYHELAARFAGLVADGRTFPLGGFTTPPRPAPAADPAVPKVLIFSPHPDDECIIGGLALRFQREAGLRVVNVAVTQGSNRERQAGRLEELRAACEYLGFELLQTADNGLERITARARTEAPDEWRRKAAVIAGILREHQPAVILFPHERDWNGTHIGVHHLVMDALAAAGDAARCLTVETEFWGAMDDPNLMVELTAGHVGDLMAATSFHVGEVNRNPYHLLLPAWLQDNVRRGGELVGGQGGTPPRFDFATLYRLGRWDGRSWERVEPAQRLLGTNLPAGTLLDRAPGAA